MENEEEIRICTNCNTPMKSGFVINGGEEYYCSDKCLNKHYTEKEWKTMYNNGNSDSYYTEWE